VWPMSSTVRSAAAEAGDNPIVQTGARLGYAASGLLHLLLAWVAMQLAWFSYGGKADQQGALATLVGHPLGSFLLWLTVVGFVLLGVWQITEAIGRRDTKARLKAVGRTVVYLALAWSAFSVVQGGSSGSSQEGVTAGLMNSSWGRLLVGLAGLAVIGVGIYHIVKGWRKKFLGDLREHPGTWLVRAGRLGYMAKGLALIVVGVLLTSAATSTSTQNANGLDGALHTILELPLGKVLLTVIAVGFAAYGVYSFARARFARV
jgi:hypothetical protein